jgi:hypothetical protein
MTVQLLIRDGSPDWWESPDIWVVPGTDPNGVAGTLVVGGPAYLWARVANQGDQDMSQDRSTFGSPTPACKSGRARQIYIGTAYAGT